MASSTRTTAKARIRPLVAFEHSWEYSGFSIHESRTGWVVHFWSRITGCTDGLRVRVPFSSEYPKGCDLNAQHNELFKRGDALAHHAVISPARRTLSSGSIVR